MSTVLLRISARGSCTGAQRRTQGGGQAPRTPGQVPPPLRAHSSPSAEHSGPQALDFALGLRSGTNRTLTASALLCLLAQRTRLLPMTSGQNRQLKANLPRPGSQTPTAPVTSAHTFSQSRRPPGLPRALFFSMHRHQAPACPPQLPRHPTPQAQPLAGTW